MIKNVVGVYVGLENDGRTPCLHVMLAQDSSEAPQAIPSQIEGYKVVVEITGEIRPLPGQGADRVTALSARIAWARGEDVRSGFLEQRDDLFALHAWKAFKKLSIESPASKEIQTKRKPVCRIRSLLFILLPSDFLRSRFQRFNVFNGSRVRAVVRVRLGRKATGSFFRRDPNSCRVGNQAGGLSDILA